MEGGSGRSLAVLGGSGFFGKSFLDAFARGRLAPWGIDRVIVVARRPETLRIQHPELVGPGVELVTLDVADPGMRLPRADYLVHAANTTDARAYKSDPLAERRAILAAADTFVRRAAVDCASARIVYTSSGAVYGAQPAGIVGLAEDMPLADAGGLIAYKRDYAEAKREAEATVTRLGREQGMSVAIARCFAFVGPYLPLDQHFAIGNFLADGMAGRTVTVRADHPVIRSYMHADDLVHWLMTIADHGSPACPIYNVGSDEAVTIVDVAAHVASRCGVAFALPEQRGGPVDRYVPSIARARSELGLTLQLDLSEAIGATITRLSSSPVP